MLFSTSALQTLAPSRCNGKFFASQKERMFFISLKSFYFVSLVLACSLISDVLQGGGDVDLLGALHHPVEDHVDEDIGPRPSHSVAAVDDHGARSPPVTLVDFPK